MASMARGSLGIIILEKLREQTDGIGRLMSLIPPDKIDWRPELPVLESRPLSVGELLGHLLDCLAGFCAVLYKASPDRLSHFSSLRELPVNFECGTDEAARRIREYISCLQDGFAEVSDGDLGRRIPTVFVPDGEAVLTLLLGNLEHLINHKYQLFFYLKLLGVQVRTADLYRLRG
jgi:hypothetical protein